MKTSSLAATVRNMDLELYKSTFLRNRHYLSGNLSSLCVNSCLPTGHLSQSICGNCLTIWLPGLALPFEANNSLTKKLKRKNWKWDVHRELWKASIYSWESKRPCSYLGLYMHAQERPKKALNSHFWLTLSLHLRRNWRHSTYRKQSAK